MKTKIDKITNATEMLNEAACKLRWCNKKKVWMYFWREGHGSSSEPYIDPHKSYSRNWAGWATSAPSEFNSRAEWENAEIIHSYPKTQQKKIDEEVASIVRENDAKTFNAEILADKKREARIKAKEQARKERQAIKKAELEKKEAAQRIIDRDAEIRKEVADRRKRINAGRETEKEIEISEESYNKYKKLSEREKKKHPIYAQKLTLLKGILKTLKRTYKMTDEEIKKISRKWEWSNTITYDFFIRKWRPTADKLDIYLKEFKKILIEKEK